MTLLKSIDIVPVTFIHGTGGNFLCSFIVAAKNNNQSPFILSDHGNMHENALKDIPTKPYSVEQSDQVKIDSIFNTEIASTYSPYYTASHIVDLQLLQTYFARSIRITYENTDIPEVSYAYMGKFWMDQKSYKKDISNLYKMNVISLTKYQPKFSKQLIDDVLFISWNDLYVGDMSSLIQKISNFTLIDKNNFNINTLCLWREKTSFCIDKIKEHKYNRL